MASEFLREDYNRVYVARLRVTKFELERSRTILLLPREIYRRTIQSGTFRVERNHLIARCAENIHGVYFEA